MPVALLDGGLAGLFGAALGGVYLPATLHRVTQTRARGGSTSATVADLPCRAQVDAASERLRAAAGTTERQVRILVPASSLSGAIATDDQISVGGQRYAVAAVDRDSAGVMFDLRARRG